MKSFDLIIIGSGMSGLTVAREALRKNPDHRICILEKSAGVGGRMATRRGDRVRFDHGAQFYRLTPEMTELHSHWSAAGVSLPWFSNEKGDHFRGREGMTALAKQLAQGLDVRLKTRVTSITDHHSHFFLQTDSDESFEANRVVMTAPLPQALDFLTASRISYSESLNEVKYAMALIALACFDGAPRFPNEFGYAEPADTEIFSVTDLQKKGISRDLAWSVCFSNAWSARHFDKAEAEVGSEMARIIQDRFGVYPSSLQVKKWRYSQPIKTADRLFEEVIPGRLFLCGDGFGGASLSGAVRSAKALTQVSGFSRQI